MRGLEVSLVEMQDHVMPSMDGEMTIPGSPELSLNKVNVYLQETAQKCRGGKVILKWQIVNSDFCLFMCRCSSQ